MERKLRITVDGREYNVTVEDLTDDGGSLYPTPASMMVAAPAAARPAAAGAPATAAVPMAGAGDITAPLAGVVDSIAVALGQTINPGDTVASLEAMKMKTPVIAKVSGKVVAIAVKVGDAVQAGQPLLTLG